MTLRFLTKLAIMYYLFDRFFGANGYEKIHMCNSSWFTRCGYAEMNNDS